MKRVTSVLIGCLAFALPVRATTLVAEDDEWHYLKGLAEASLPDTAAWRAPGFTESTWSAGRGPFFYELGAGYVGNTELPEMNGGYTCVFLRREFDLPTAAGISSLKLDLRVDDGCIVWLNGQEIARVNMPEGEPTFQGTSLPAAGDPNVASFDVANPSTLLRAGRNVLAVQAFNNTLAGSSDFLIAASLTSPEDLTPPRVIETFPAAASVVRELTQVEVVFDEAVTGVDPGDLLIAGRPATTVEAFSPRNYGFKFAEPAAGPIEIRWATGHGITDLAPARNAFAGAGWTYTLDKTAPAANVILSEFLADNRNGIRDDFAERSDWIELYNLDATALNLAGWFLTDDATKPAKWKFPVVTIPAGGYLLVWASERNLTSPARPLHTNFRLSATGEYLALLDPDTNVVSAFAPKYPPQQPNISFGRVPGSPATTGFFPTPTPGTRNGDSGPGFAPEPQFSLAGGFFTNSPVEVTITAPAGVVRYTTDGTVPTEASPIAEAPLPLITSTVIHARVFQAGLLPGPVRVEAYSLGGTGVNSFSSNLPLLVIQTSGRGIAQDSRIPVHVTAYEPFRGRAALIAPPALTTKAQMEVRGQSSAGFPKLSYNLELNDPYGRDVEVPLLGLPQESDWVLYAPYTDKPLIHNFLAYELHRKMGHWAPRCRFVELFIETSGRLDYNLDYRGIYLLVEKIKADNNRVDIARLTPYDTTEPGITGGYMIKKDKDSPGDRGFGSNGGGGFSGQYLKYHEPKPREITPLQETWIRNYVNRFESALYAPDWLARTGTNHYSAFIDVDSFVDNHWIVEFAKQIDGYRLSNYLHKDRGGKLMMDPIWDWNLSFGNADYLDGQNTANWYYPQLGDADHIWLRRLICGTPWSSGTSGDPDFNQRIADRWSELRTNVFSSTNLIARIDELATYLNEAQAREFKRWPRLGQYIWPNPPIYSTPTTYAGVVTAMKTWVRGRYDWIDNQFLQIPTFSHPGGWVSPGFPLSLSAGLGVIYYTTDGSDPRAPGGAVAASASPFVSTLSLGENSRVVARLRINNRWSGPAAATFVVTRPPLAITELMFRPRLSSVTDTNDPSAYEYIELKNSGSAVLDLRGFEFTDGIQFRFATGTVTSLNSGGRVVVARNAAAFKQRYGAIAELAGEFAGTLANEGERITLRGPRQEPVLSFTFDPDWHSAADGLGFALVTNDEDNPSADLDSADAWRVGSVLDGTPGNPEPAAPAILPVFVNEVLSHTEPSQSRWIELHNPNDQPADIGGWFLTDDRRTPKFRIPDGTSIPSRGFRVFAEAEFNANPGAPTSFNLGADGDDAYLLSADPTGRLTGYVHGFAFGASSRGASFGRHLTSTGDEQFVAQARPTPAAPNAGPWVGPVVISELMYHPPDVLANGALWDNTEDEYVELTNLASTNVALFDSRAPTNTWSLRDAVQYEFPANQVLAAGERVLVVSFDPATQPAAAGAFRLKYGLANGVRLFGPFRGKLANDHNSVELVRPDLVLSQGTNVTAVGVLADKVAYHDHAPWPPGADGTGFSLQRLTEAAFGNDSANWVAAAPTPGTFLPPTNPPTITTQPASRSVRPGETATFEVAVAAAEPVRYRWRFHGAILPGATSAALSIVNAQPTNAGTYEVVVLNAARAIVSQPAGLRVGYPPEIIRQPASRQVPAGGATEILVVAAGDSPLAYQWRKNGQPLSGANRPSLAFAGLKLSDAGTYDVVISGDAGSTTSEAATLTVLAPPIISQPPISQTVGKGETLTLSAAVEPGANVPLTFVWTRDGAKIAVHTRTDGVDLLSVPNAQASDAGQYQVRITNQAAPAGVLSEAAAVSIVEWADADADGMPDWFEQRFGFLPNDVADASLDPDGDGMSNRDEYRAGTDPKNPASVLRLEAPVLGSYVVIRFQAQANRTYTVLASDRTTVGTWRTVGAVPAVSATPYQARIVETQELIPPSAPERYYLIVTPGIAE